MHHLYRITNLLNNKVYIGQSDNVSRRWAYHKNQATKEKPVQYINRAMRKYGVDNFSFEVIASCRTQDDADETEILLILQYDSRNKNKGYNIKPGGETWDAEMRQYMSEKIKQHYIDHPEDRQRVSEQTKILWQNPDHLAKMKKVPHPNKMKGKSISEGQRLTIVKGVKHLKGIKTGPLSEEVKKKVSETKKNFSKERKEAIADAITKSRGQTVLSKEQKANIAADKRSSYVLAEEYNVNPATIQRIKKKSKS